MISETEIQRIKNLQSEIDNAKNDLAEWTGQKKECMKQLEESFGVSSLKEAQSLLQKLEIQEKELETEIQQGITFLETEYDF